MANLLNQITLANLDLVRMTESGYNLSSGDEGKSLNAVKVSVLNSHDALISEELLGVVVDELSVDEHIHVVTANQIDLLLHLLFLSQLEFRDLRDIVDLDPGPKHLDLVSVHRGVGDQNPSVLNPLGLMHSNLLVKQESCNNFS